jgi:catechol 2,3-dioxygenase-like lactoylglutathione lyase family enzyme
MTWLALVAVVVPDYDEAIDFYVRRVGFELVEDSPQQGKRWVVVRPPGSQAGLLLARATTDDQRAVVGRQAAGRVWLFLETDDFDADHRRMLAAGVRFCEEPRQEPYGMVAVWEDPYGNRWDLLGAAQNSIIDSSSA